MYPASNELCLVYCIIQVVLDIWSSNANQLILNKISNGTKLILACSSLTARNPSCILRGDIVRGIVLDYLIEVNFQGSTTEVNALRVTVRSKVPVGSTLCHNYGIFSFG